MHNWYSTRGYLWEPMGSSHGIPWVLLLMESHGKPSELPMGSHQTPWVPRGCTRVPHASSYHVNSIRNPWESPWTPMGSHRTLGFPWCFPWGPTGTHADPWEFVCGDPREPISARGDSWEKYRLYGVSEVQPARSLALANEPAPTQDHIVLPIH